jgi:hypothetical protein
MLVLKFTLCVYESLIYSSIPFLLVLLFAQADRMTLIDN